MRAVIHLVVRAAVAATAQAQKPGVPAAGAVLTMTRDAQAEASGDTASLHAGDVDYRMAAITPGAMVTVTAAPATGDPPSSSCWTTNNCAF